MTPIPMGNLDDHVHRESRVEFNVHVAQTIRKEEPSETYLFLKKTYT